MNLPLREGWCRGRFICPAALAQLHPRMVPTPMSLLALRSRNHDSAAQDLLDELREDAELARREIREGRFQRSMALVTAFSAAVSGFEAYSQHQRGAFNDRWMWTPVWLAPPTVAAAGAALKSERVARRVLPTIALVSLADGVLG